MTTIHLTDAELWALRLVTAVGVMAFTTPAGPAHIVKKRMEDNNGIVITLEDIAAALAKIGVQSHTQQPPTIPNDHKQEDQP